ncbi:unnamed protein product [Anisakis simplex]|uniref:Ground-like domain-containing protein n=1 Tax=Anisakis simplex TaxID=6269 RepID=A0A0M3JYG1_ANISI|nr:unnamed protein product [Anisakis simplex]
MILILVIDLINSVHTHYPLPYDSNINSYDSKRFGAYQTDQSKYPSSFVKQPVPNYPQPPCPCPKPYSCPSQYCPPPPICPPPPPPPPPPPIRCLPTPPPIPCPVPPQPNRCPFPPSSFRCPRPPTPVICPPRLPPLPCLSNPFPPPVPYLPGTFPHLSRNCCPCGNNRRAIISPNAGSYPNQNIRIDATTNIPPSVLPPSAPQSYIDHENVHIITTGSTKIDNQQQQQFTDTPPFIESSSQPSDDQIKIVKSEQNQQLVNEETPEGIPIRIIDDHSEIIPKYNTPDLLSATSSRDQTNSIASTFQSDGKSILVNPVQPALSSGYQYSSDAITPSYGYDTIRREQNIPGKYTRQEYIGRDYARWNNPNDYNPNRQAAQHIAKNDSSQSKRQIQEAAEEQFGGHFNVICGTGEFSYVAHTQKFCQYSTDDITCYVFRPL